MTRITRAMLQEAYRKANDADRVIDPDDKRSMGEREMDAIVEHLNRELAKNAGT